MNENLTVQNKDVFPYSVKSTCVLERNHALPITLTSRSINLLSCVAVICDSVQGMMLSTLTSLAADTAGLAPTKLRRCSSVMSVNWEVKSVK